MSCRSYQPWLFKSLPFRNPYHNHDLSLSLFIKDRPQSTSSEARPLHLEVEDHRTTHSTSLTFSSTLLSGIRITFRCDHSQQWCFDFVIMWHCFQNLIPMPPTGQPRGGQELHYGSRREGSWKCPPPAWRWWRRSTWRRDQSPALGFPLGSQWTGLKWHLRACFHSGKHINSAVFQKSNHSIQIQTNSKVEARIKVILHRSLQTMSTSATQQVRFFWLLIYLYLNPISWKYFWQKLSVAKKILYRQSFSKIPIA